MKHLSKFLLIPLAVLAFAGCNKGGEEPSKEGSSTPPKEVSYTVSQTEFASALDFKWKNLSYVGTTFGPGADGRCEMYLLADGSLYQKECFGWGEHIFYHLPDDSYSYITKKDSVWFVGGYRTKTEYVSGSYGDDFGFFDMIYYCHDKYESFTYSETDHQYTGQVVYESFTTDPFDIVLKFEDKHVVYFEMSMIYEGARAGYRVEVSNHGTTMIDYNSFNIQNKFDLAGRSFVFENYIDHGMFGGDPTQEQAFKEGNANSTLTFSSDGTYTMHFDFGFYPYGEEQEYTGQYTLDKFAKTISFKVDLGEEEPMDVVADFEVDVKDGEAWSRVVISMEPAPGMEFVMSFAD